MSAVLLRAKCPTCGAVREAKASGDGYAMQKHTHPAHGYGAQKCAGGAVTSANVLAWTKVARDEKADVADGIESLREAARARLVEELAIFDAKEAALRTSVAAYDRAIARIEKKEAP